MSQARRTQHFVKHERRATRSEGGEGKRKSRASRKMRRWARLAHKAQFMQASDRMLKNFCYFTGYDYNLQAKIIAAFL